MYVDFLGVAQTVTVCVCLGCICTINVNLVLLAPSTDQRGFPRAPQGLATDIGSFEAVLDPTADTDGDGLSDEDEVNIYGTDATKADTDGDGLSDSEEINVHGTDSLNSDSDGGGISDGQEIEDGTDPLDPNDDALDLSEFLPTLPDGFEYSAFGLDPFQTVPEDAVAWGVLNAELLIPHFDGFFGVPGATLPPELSPLLATIDPASLEVTEGSFDVGDRLWITGPECVFGTTQLLHIQGSFGGHIDPAPTFFPANCRHLLRRLCRGGKVGRVAPPSGI